MKISKIILVSIIFLIYHIKSTPTPIKRNIYNKISLNKEITEILFKPENNNYIKAELIFSHPSKYYTTFNEYSEENESNINKETNQTDLIIKSELIFGKNKVLLKTKDNNIDGVLLSIFLKDNKGENDFVYIKYTLSENIENEKYGIKDHSIQLEQNEGMLFINFSGINQIEKDENITNIKTDFVIKIFDKNTLESLYENIYACIYDSKNIEDKSLISKTMKLKGSTITSNMFVKLEQNQNEKKEQILLINARVYNDDNEKEEILHYEFLTFKINDPQNGTDEKTEEEKEEEEVKQHREDNQTLLFIFLGIFVGLILITFIIIFVYLKCYGGGDAIEEDQDYSNIGGITATSSNEKDGTTDDNKTADE
jgi:hypothetical protein